MNRKFKLPSILLLFSMNVFAQNAQFASMIIDFSSEYSPQKFSAREALGKPLTLPEGEWRGTTWSPAENTSNAYIKVGFKNPMKIRQVAIFMFYNSGCITNVYGYDTDGNEYLLFKQKPKNDGIHKKTLYIKMKETSYELASLKIECDFTPFPANTRCHIDAIGISNSDTPIEAKINLNPEGQITGTPKNLGPKVNSTCSELLPIVSCDGGNLFFLRSNCNSNFEGAKENFADIYFSKKIDGSWTKAENIGKPLNNTGNNALASISPDGNRVLLFGNYYEDGRYDATGGLSMSHRTKDGWSFPENIEIENFYTQSDINNYFLASDGKTLILCIARMDSYGEADMYVSFKTGDKKWSEPKHMGPNINTASLEFSPYLAPDGITLYFSSWGLPGYGQADMYYSRRLDDTWQNWSEPINLGPPINTAYFDSYFKVSGDGKTGYFVSTKNSIGADDIFTIDLPEYFRPEPVVLIKGKTLNKDSKEPIAAIIQYEVLTKNGKEVGETTSDPNTGYYSIVLPYKNRYGFHASSQNYISLNYNLDLTSVAEYKEIEQNILMIPIETGKTIVLNNIFFDFNKSVLKEESFLELKRLADLMKENPSLIIELRGHTDDQGDDSYNLSLSSNRAKSVFDYLIENGIKTGRLSYKGYGETIPIADNNTEDGRLLNRRVELYIVKK